jgi:hypothetical protein
MSNLRKAAEQALEALENAKSYDKEDLFGFDDEIAALRTALEAEQETTPKKGSYEAVFGHLGMTPDELGNYMITLQMLAEVIVANDVAARKQDEPVAWVTEHDVQCFNSGPGESTFLFTKHGIWNVPLYTAPQPAQQPLTEELLHSLWLYTPVDYYTDNESIFKQAARAIEHAHNIK